jgi:hypothetical protein
MDATGAENHTTILVIEPSPIERDMLWVGTDDGRVHYSLNSGGSWTDVSKNIKGLPAGSWIVQIKASNKAKGEALLVANDYRRFNYEAYVYRTKDYGKTWTRIVDNSDVQSYALSIVEDPKEKNLLFLGTDDGLYVSLDAGSSWTKWTNEFPTVPVKDLVIHPREHDLVIGTFGRAAWVLDDIRPLRAMAANAAVKTAKVTLFDPPVGYQAAYQQPTGSRFGGDALYNGENKGFGAPIRYFINPADAKKSTAKKGKKGGDDSKNKTPENIDDDEDTDDVAGDDAADENGEEMAKNEVKWDSLSLKIYDGTRLIRTLKQKAPKDAGLYNFTWFMREAGGDRPSRSIRKRRSEPGGVGVKPGTYRLELSYGDQVSSSQIKIASDPRLDVPQKAINDTYDNGKTIQAMTQTAADAVKQLVESKQIANDYKDMLSKLDKKANKESIDQSKEMVKKIDSVIAMYLGKIDTRQGITRNPEVTIMQQIGLARQYAGSRPNGTTSTETTLFANARAALKEGLDATNAFFVDHWGAYRTKMEALNVSAFKETKQFTLD